MARRHGPALLLGVALALLGGSIAWAVGDAGGSSWLGHRYAYGPAMMGYGYSTASAGPVTSPAEARRHAQAFADRLGLRVDEVLRFERNFYAKLVDRKGEGATEVLVDPATGATSVEYGPAMMWNTVYGMAGGRYGAGTMGSVGTHSMMGAYGGMMGGGMMGGYAQPAAASVSLARAHALAQRWLDANQPGTKVETGGDSFPGYYTLETLRSGRIAGMISVNAGTGAVWPHWWHGRFLGSE